MVEVDEVLRGHPVAALSRVSRTADLLVVGAHDRPRGVPRLGSVSHGAIHHTECPLAVVSPSWTFAEAGRAGGRAL